MNGWRALGFNSYLDYLNSDIWLEKKWHLIDTIGECEICGEKIGLVVHHLSYWNVGNEGRKDLLVLCHQCHNKFHKKKNV